MGYDLYYSCVFSAKDVIYCRPRMQQSGIGLLRNLAGKEIYSLRAAY